MLHYNKPPHILFCHEQSQTIIYDLFYLSLPSHLAMIHDLFDIIYDPCMTTKKWQLEIT